MTCRAPCGTRSSVRSSRTRGAPVSAGSEWQREPEGRAALGARLGPDAPAVGLDHAPADRQPDAAALVAVLAMQPVERAEDPLRLFRRDPDPGVLDRHPHAMLALGLGTHVHRRRAPV